MKSILAVCFLLMMTPAFAAGLLFSQMKDGDKMQVTEKSIGCFHNTVSYYEVARTAGAYSFAVYKITWSDGAPPLQIVKQEEVGRMAISSEDIQKLDELLRFYRTPNRAGSTTTVTLVIEFKQLDGPKLEETLKDDTGGYGLEKRKDVITFETLTKRLKNEPEARTRTGGDEAPAK